MSRTIGKATSWLVSTRASIGPTSTIWCTAGVSGIVAPAIAARRGLHTPQAMTTWSAAMRPWSVTTALDAHRRSTSMSSTSVLANTVSTPLSIASWRISVPACSESTTDTLGV